MKEHGRHPAPGEVLRLTAIYAVLCGIVWTFSKQEELREGRLDSVCPWQESHRLFLPSSSYKRGC